MTTPAEPEPVMTYEEIVDGIMTAIGELFRLLDEIEYEAGEDY